MKKHVFAYVETKRTPRRTYGGSNYTLTVYEITGGKVERLGSVEACTAAHKGEESEAWGVVLKERPNVAKLLTKRIKGDKYLSGDLNGGYYRWQFKNYGVELHQL